MYFIKKELIESERSGKKSFCRKIKFYELFNYLRFCNWLRFSPFLGAGMGVDSGLHIYRTPEDFAKASPKVEHKNVEKSAFDIV